MNRSRLTFAHQKATVELTPLSPTALSADNRAGASAWPLCGLVTH